MWAEVKDIRDKAEAMAAICPGYKVGASVSRGAVSLRFEREYTALADFRQLIR